MNVEHLIGFKHIVNGSKYCVVTLVRILCLAALKSADFVSIPANLSVSEHPYLHTLIEKAGVSVVAVFRYTEINSDGIAKSGYLVAIEGELGNKSTGEIIPHEEMPEGFAVEGCNYVAFEDSILENFCSSKTVLYNPKTANYELKINKGRSGNYVISVIEVEAKPLAAVVKAPVAPIVTPVIVPVAAPVKPSFESYVADKLREKGFSGIRHSELDDNIECIVRNMDDIPIVHIPLAGSRVIAYLCAPCNYINIKKSCNKGKNCRNFNCYAHEDHEINEKLIAIINDKNNKSAAALLPVLIVLQRFWAISARGEETPKERTMVKAIIEALHYVNPDYVGKNNRSDSERSYSDEY